MFNTLINCIKGVYTVDACGRFPERILNIASTSGIYLRNIKRKDSETLSFSVGKKGYEKLISTEVSGVSLTLTESYGIPVFFRKYKKRIMLLFLPLFFTIIATVFSFFVWRVEITGGDETLREKVLVSISDKGVHIGALKHKIDQYEVKRTSIMEIDDLSWLWVDIRGTTAMVKIQERTPKPDIIPVNEPSDVISLHDGVIEKMQVYCGVPLVKEGDAVEKGQILVTGIFRSENENIPTYYHHATADITVRLFKEKTVIIPKKNIKKIPTGRKKSVFGIKFKKNQINFSLNSGISYKEYDKIEKKYALPLLPLSFTKTEYHEATVKHTETVISDEIEMRRKKFLEELQKENMELIELTENTMESDNAVNITFSADCRVRTDKEIPVKYSEGVNDGENS